MAASARGAPRSATVASGDGHVARLVLCESAGEASDVVLWLPALGVAARHYVPFAQALSERGIAVAVHEWRGAGSSSLRAGCHVDWGYRELLCEDIAASRAAVRTTWPRARGWLGGHSIGGQLASLAAALAPAAPHGLLLVASGAPYWRLFRARVAVRAAYGLAPLLAQACGHFPGRALRFGGREARGVIGDWSRSGRTGRYSAAGLGANLEDALAALRIPVRALRLRDDWLGPQASLEWLLAKMPGCERRADLAGPSELGTRADHFGWMKAPAGVAAWADAQIRGAADGTPTTV